MSRVLEWIGTLFRGQPAVDLQRRTAETEKEIFDDYEEVATIKNPEWQAAKDRIVDHVLRGETDTIPENVALAFEAGAGERSYPWTDLDEPLYEDSRIRDVLVPDDLKGVDLRFLAGIIDDDRLDELHDGAPETEAEYRLFVRHWLERAKSLPGDFDEAVSIWRVRHSDGRQCVALITVSGFPVEAGVEHEGFFSSVEVAMEYLNIDGLLQSRWDDPPAISAFVERCVHVWRAVGT